MDEKQRMQIIAENITHFRKQRGITQKELAKEVGITPSTMTDYMKLRSAPSFGVIQKLSDYFGVKKSDIDTTFKEESTNSLPDTPDLLTQQITDKVVQLTPDNKKIVLRTSEELLKKQNEEETKINEVSEKIVQLYGYDYYDHATSAGTGQYLNDVRVEQIELPIDVDADFVIPIKGDSMEPDYHDGDLVFIQTSVDLNDGVIGVFNYNGEAYIKQLVIDTEQAYLHSLNPDYKDMPITPETDFRIIGEVVDLYREK
ncbi:helix-turn-helix domain-containing protein [Streptococcus mitis]|uniref:helix-turn-helix domain-containing protein n=1 Tax=Streptococcus mitis TaxID=28037 RepID=UPI001BE449B9|nr:S24 family peptidase [Streptococcus mitis]MBT2174483.1 helix-turn-helix domain-containing protein [Streptococcus mitis]MBT2174555.1 helix-turn-helix domain-containing protein [Streptococcus mitis]